jgi:transposase
MRPVAERVLGVTPPMNQAMNHAMNQATAQPLLRIDAVWLAVGVSDLRRGMDSLLGHVVQHCAGGAAKHSAYVFANRGATRLKILLYDGAGLWLCSRRLQSGRFVWPQAGSGSVDVSPEQLAWLVTGAPWQHVAAGAAITRV